MKWIYYDKLLLFGFFIGEKVRLRQFFVISTLFFSIFLAHASDPKITYLKGHSIAFSALKGKWVFINYWASWCQPCLSEIATFNRFYQTNKTKVALFAVNYESLSKNEQQALVKKLHIHYPSLEDPRKQLHLRDITGVPTTFVFDPTGHLNTVLYGPQSIRKLNKVMQEKK